MAVSATPISGDMAIIFDQAGTAVTRRFSDVKVDATDDYVYDVANGTAGLATLQDLTVSAIQRRMNSELINSI